MSLPREYFEIQMEYAKAVSSTLEISLDEALRLFTSYWRIIGNQGYEYNGESFSANAHLWTELQERSKVSLNIVESAIAMRSENHAATSAYKRYFGCFRYDYYNVPDVYPEHPYKEDRGVIKIHFANHETVKGVGPLSHTRIAQRKSELREMFVFIKQNHPEAKVVHGVTWLYNIPAYTRLFPSEYTSQLIEESPFPRTQGIWGQFLTNNGNVNTQRAEIFSERFENALNENELLYAFPFQIMLARTTIQSFYNFYELE